MRVHAATFQYAFSPFDGDERIELWTHVTAVQDLLATTFAQPGSLSWTLPVDLGSVARTHADDALDAAIPAIRRLWRHDEPGSFLRVQRLLRAHAATRDTPEAREVQQALDAARRQHKQILQRSAYGCVMEEQVDEHGRSAGSTTPSPKRLLDDFINGRVIHGDPDKRARVDDWTGFHKWALIDAATSLTEFYSGFAIGPIQVLHDGCLHR